MPMSLPRSIALILVAIAFLTGCQNLGAQVTPVTGPRQSALIDTAALDADIQKRMAEKQVPGMNVLIIQGDQIIFQKTYGTENLESGAPMTLDSPVRLASASKVLTGMLALSMAEKGDIDLNARIGDLLVDAPDAWKAIPLWRLLNHTSGLPRFLNFEEFEKLSNEEKAAYTHRQVFDVLAKLPLDFEPGGNWRYQQSGYSIMAMILTEKTGKSWDQLLDEYVYQPAGMTQTQFGDSLGVHPVSYVIKDNSLQETDYYYPRAFSMGGGYNSTSNDMLNLFKALHSGKPVSKDFLKAQLFDDGRLTDLGSEKYGPATIVKTFGTTRTIGHSGGGGLADIRYAPDKEIGIAVFSNLGSSGVAIELTESISAQLFGEKIETEKE